MFFVWALALAGLFLIYLEFFLPGAIMAIGGSILLLASVFMFCLAKPNLLLLVLYLIALAAAVYALVRFAQWRIRFVEKKDILDAVLSPKEMIGCVAKTSTKLTPAGHICIGDKQYKAISENGPLEKGIDVIVVGKNETDFLVQIQPIPKDPS